MSDMSVIWRRLDEPGHDAARLLSQALEWHLNGTAVFVSNRRPCRLDYLVVCDLSWRTISGRVTGWLGEDRVEMEITVDDGCWRLNGVEFPAVAGCIDLDFKFSPATNLLPIRRLELEVGAASQARAAWLEFPSPTLQPLDQLYLRTGERTYRYESSGGFARDLRVNAAGFVIDYPGFWQMETGAGLAAGRGSS